MKRKKNKNFNERQYRTNETRKKNTPVCVGEGGEEEEECLSGTEAMDRENFKKVLNFNIMATNARSITPKIDCLIEYLNELESSTYGLFNGNLVVGLC